MPRVYDRMMADLKVVINPTVSSIASLEEATFYNAGIILSGAMNLVSGAANTLVGTIGSAG